MKMIAQDQAQADADNDYDHPGKEYRGLFNKVVRRDDGLIITAGIWRGAGLAALLAAVGVTAVHRITPAIFLLMTCHKGMNV